jgi:hypothetical protein
VLEGDEYVVNGGKMWITNSLHGHLTLLLVKTDPTAEPRHKGMSMLIAEKGPGYTVVGKLKKMGYRSIDTCELHFENYRVPKSRLLGGEEGKGFIHTASGLELGRINVGPHRGQAGPAGRAGCPGRCGFRRARGSRCRARPAGRTRARCRRSAIRVLGLALWLPVTTSTPRPPWAMNSVNSAYSSVGVKR